MRKIGLITAVSLSIIVGGWLLFDRYEYQKEVQDVMAALDEPKSHLGLWNATNMRADAYLNYHNGDTIYVELRGGVYASYEPGVIGVLVNFENGSSIELEALELKQDAELKLSIYADRIELR